MKNHKHICHLKLIQEKKQYKRCSKDSPQESGSSDRSPQSSSRSHVQDMGMQRPLAQGYWFGGHVRAGRGSVTKLSAVKMSLLVNHPS